MRRISFTFFHQGQFQHNTTVYSADKQCIEFKQLVIKRS